MLHNKYVEVVKEFLKGYFVGLYGGGLTKKISLSQKSISITLDELENMGVLISKFSGNRKYFSLNFANPLIGNYLVLFEYFQKISFLEKNRNFIDFSNEVSGDIVCVFGSYAKSKNNSSSDLDLLVVGKVDTMGIKRLGEKYGYDVQVFNFSLSSFRKGYKDNLVLKECLGNHVLIKGENIFVKEVLKWEK